MVRIYDYRGPGAYTKSPQREGLQEFVRFPDSEIKREGVPNSTVWAFDRTGHRYQTDILADDIGCGMIAMQIDPVDPVEAADATLETLRDRNILGRGNHFVDFCTHPYETGPETDLARMVLLHTDAKGTYFEPAKSVGEAIDQQAVSQEFREELTGNIVDLLGLRGEVLGDWPHNTVERTPDEIIYRKGAVRVEKGSACVLPAHLGAELFFYTPNADDMPPRNSMPHATGRAGPRGKLKVGLEEAEQVRQLVYIPAGIQTTSLRSEHPSCYNSTDDIFRTLGKHMIPTGSARILSYVGKA